MRILVDADACPVNRSVEQVAEQYKIPLVFVCDENHTLSSAYGDIIFTISYSFAHKVVYLIPVQW